MTKWFDPSLQNITIGDANTTFDGSETTLISQGGAVREIDLTDLYPLYGIVLGTEQSSTSGTTIDFTGIPSRAKRIVVTGIGVSLSGTDDLLIQIGDSGGIETTSYTSASNSSAGGVQSTSGMRIVLSVAADTIFFVMTFNLENASTNQWICSHNAIRSDNVNIYGAGIKALSSTLDRVRVTTTGTNTFDAGVINISYQ